MVFCYTSAWISHRCTCVCPLLLFPPHLLLILPLKGWTHQSDLWGLESPSPLTPVNVDIWTTSPESQVFLMASRAVKPFQKAYRLLSPGPSEELLSVAAVSLQNVFLKKKKKKRCERGMTPWSMGWRMGIVLADMKTGLILLYFSIRWSSQYWHVY